MNVLYLDCFAGISGDMCLGALIDAGVDSGRLERDLRKLPVHGWKLTVARKNYGGITGTKVDIEVREDHQPHRHFGDIKDLILDSPLPEKVQKNSLKIFERLAEAEGKVHGVPAGHVHFHEVGGVDSIIDIVGTSLALFYLNIESLHCSPVPTGRGTIKCRHGILPVPAPATAELLKGVPISPVDVEGEMTTPTGAAIATAFSPTFGPLPEMSVEAVGYGFGSKDYGIPNFLRIFTGVAGEDKALYDYEPVAIIETNIDDMNPEFLGFITERMFENSALDVFMSPAYMKKNRPGYLLTVLCRPQNREKLLKIIFSETSTLGVRCRQETKVMLGRLTEEVDTPYGRVRIKKALDSSGSPLRAAPEYEDCKKIALEKGVPLRVIYEAALLAALTES
ncbi:MAG: nickel pincer cofactor biosynthesis protein LarC [Bacillota bacterium]